ncbi:MAG TPA: hypothetical protein VEJ18_00820 [Planctomycetota bacterium]|nr:hypothetical protein [Planctomycetota bacterium]
MDGAQLQAISAGVAGALSPTFGSTLDARAAFGPGVPLRFLRVAVWSDRVLAGSPDDASRKTAVETLRLRDTAAESFLIGASIDASAVRAIARTAFASFPRFYKFTGTDPATHDNADVEMRSLNLLIDSLPEDVPFTAGNEVVVFTARFELCHPKIPGTSLTIDLTDRVWATGGQALGTRTMISDVAASFWDNPLLWFATQILKLLAQSGIVSTFLSERGGFGTQFARILPPDLPILGTRRKFVFDYRNSRLESNAIVLRADYEVTDRTPALTVEGPTEVTRILLRADRDPARTTALTAAYRATTLDFTPTRYQWVLLGGPARIVLGPDAPQFDPVFIVPRTWGFGTFFIGCAASDDAGNQASGYLFVDAGLLSPPPHLPRPPIPQKQE